MKILFSILRLTASNILIYAQALFLVVLLWFEYVAPESIVFGYFLETIIIGILHAVKLYLVTKHETKDRSDPNTVQGYGSIVFFLAHYGFFVAIQMIFVFSFFQGTIPGITSGFNLIHNFGVLMGVEGMEIILTTLIITNLSYFYTNFYRPKKYKEYSPSDIFFSPYIRIFIQQFAVILAGFFMVFMNASYAAATILLIIRLLVDLCMIAIKKNSETLEELASVLAKDRQDTAEVQEQLERFSE